MEKLNYKISSRAAILLGRENVSNTDGALIELIKNSYDADATMCFLYFDTIQDKLYIIDNGSGMTKDTIENCWLVIGTDNKSNDYETSKKRIKSGEKGIGRLALDRLGEKYTIYTKNKNNPSSYYSFVTSWNDFEKKGLSLSDIYIELNSTLGSLRDVLPYSVVNDLKDNSFIDDFDMSGTVIVIEKLRDKWDLNNFNKIENMLSTLIPPVEQIEFNIFIKNTIDNECKAVKSEISDEYDYKIFAKFTGKEFLIDLYRNEFDINKMPEALFKYEIFKKYPYRKEDFRDKHFSFSYSINELMNTNDSKIIEMIEKIGKFEFHYLFMKMAADIESKDIYYYKEISKNRNEWLKNHSGVKIYRDNFMVRPYGIPSTDSYDWIGLDAIRAKSPAGISHSGNAWRVRNAQGQGTLFISRIDNPEILDKSSREGIIDNLPFQYLKRVIEKILLVFEKDRSDIGYYMKKFYETVNKNEITQQKGLELATNIIKQKNQKAKKTTEEANEQIQTLAETVKIFEQEKEENISELKMLRSLASNGLITTSIVHDLKTINASLVERGNILKKRIKNQEETLIEESLNTLLNDDKFLKSWITVITSQVRQDRRNRKKNNIYKIILDIKAVLQPILDRKSVELIIEEPSIEIFKKVFITDFDAIFYNLIINSIEAFETERINKRQIKISIYEKENIEIYYEDTGKGLNNIFKDSYEIFDYGVTSKIDQNGNKVGSGLGMYIVASTINDYGGEYKLLETVGKFKMRITIPKEMSNNNE